jgi:PGF-pre-PGF domain-containing protein
MSNKRHLLLAVFAVILVNFVFIVSAAQSIAIVSPTSNFSNFTGTARYLNASILGVDGTSLVGNVTFYYQPWSYLNNASWILIGVVANTSTNQTTFNTTWDTTGVADGKNYTINASARRYGDTDAFNGTNRTANITIDNTPPTMVVYTGADLTAYANGTIRQSITAASNKTLINISVTDATVGLLNSSNLFCFAHANGTNQSSPVAGGFCNFSLDLNGLEDGNQTIKIYLNDTLNNMRLNSTLVIQVDTTDPSATASCTSSVQTGDSFPCTCSTSDATSGINSGSSGGGSSSPDGTSTPANTGSFTFTCNAVDYGGLTASATRTYTVTQPPSIGSASSSSGSSAGVTTAPSKVLSEISPGVASVSKYADPNLGIKEITINVNNKAQNVKIDVKKYEGKPAAVSVEKTGKVYQYLQIEVSNVVGKLDNAKITTKVEKAWVSENGLGKEDVVVSKFDNATGQWNELSTTYSSEDDTYYYYDAEVKSFSYFAIGQKSAAVVQEEETTTSPIQGIKDAVSGSGMKTLWIVVIVLVIIAILYGIKRMRNN